VSTARSVLDRAIEEIAAAGGRDEHAFEFVCECSNLGCDRRLPMTLSRYEQIRRDPTLFVVAPGHDLPEIESVVAREPDFQVVRKHGEAADFVTERDPRGGS
jgi:hypothetical protein